MVKKTVTIDDLAVMVKKGFDEVYRIVTNGFEISNKRFDKIEGRLDKIEWRLGKVDERLLNLEADASYLKARSSAVDIAFSKHEDAHDEITIRLKKVERARN